MQVVEFYTDGSCLSNPGVGAWAVFMPGVGSRYKAYGHTTNNKMELQAIIEALRWAYEQNAQIVTIHTDSQYCISGITEWTPKWINKGWRTAGGGKVKNIEQWKEVLRLSQSFTEIIYNKVKAHSGIPGNEYVDKKARSAAERYVK
jgi:ribonuclease HI